MTQVEVFKEDDLEITAPEKKGGGKVLTEKQKAFLSYLGNEAEGDIRMAMQLAGYSQNTRPDDVLRHLTEEIIEVSSKLIATNSVKAVSKLIGILDNPNRPGSKEIIAAAKEVLDRAGVFKNRDSNNGPTIRADNVFILPAKEPIDRVRLSE